MTMSRWLSGLALALALNAASPTTSSADVHATLSDKDRAEIQALLAAYAPALIGCKPEAWADLFATPGGYFASGPRGEVRERLALMEMVLSYERCDGPPAAGAPPSNVPTTVPRPNPQQPPPAIEPSPSGAKARIRYGRGGGYYDDEYVKTPTGWKFKSRTVISDEEIAAKLTTEDFIEIRKLAGDDHGHFENLYGDHDNPTPRSGTAGKQPFRVSGLRLLVSPEGVRGLAYVRDNGGRYEDLYERTSGGWRIKQRTYVPPAGK
jgi:hypothetical protein